MILAGDIGGTKTDLAVFDADLGLVARQEFASREHGSLDELVRAFSDQHRLAIDRACFGIAGPVRGGIVTATNLPWTVSAGELSRTLGIDAARLINDLEATAFGVGVLGQDDLATLHAGAPDASGHAAVIAAGTGLGEAGLYWDGRRHHAYASEGGHATFAPRTDLEIALLRFLEADFGHVSWERVLSGPGLFNIYRFLRDTRRQEEPPWLTEELRRGDPPAAISRAALRGACDLCVAALDLFVKLYGAEAGNLALKAYATGGVYVAGGIAPKILDKLKDGTFVTAFVDKGRLRPVLEAIPIRVVLSDMVSLLGAAQCARLSAGPAA
jgi:glucokinase